MKSLLTALSLCLVSVAAAAQEAPASKTSVDARIELPDAAPPAPPAPPAPSNPEDRFGRLERLVEMLTREVAALRREVAELRRKEQHSSAGPRSRTPEAPDARIEARR